MLQNLVIIAKNDRKIAIKSLFYGKSAANCRIFFFTF